MKYGQLDFIRDRLSQAELLAQLAEECAELGKAALKLRRVYNGENPTPVTEKEAYENILEEIADVALCIEALELNNAYTSKEIRKTMNAKANRWAMRLEEMKCPVCGETINTKAKECPNCRVSRPDPDDFIGEYEEENE